MKVIFFFLFIHFFHTGSMTISPMFVLLFFYFLTSLPLPQSAPPRLCRNPIVSNHGHNFILLFLASPPVFIVSVALHVAFGSSAAPPPTVFKSLTSRLLFFFLPPIEDHQNHRHHPPLLLLTAETPPSAPLACPAVV